MNQRTSPHWKPGEFIGIGKPFQYQRAFQEEVQAVRTGGGTAAGSRVQDGEGNI